MKILILCNKPPFPAKDGGSLAEKNLIEGLIREGHQVKIVSVNAPKYGVTLKDIPEEIITKTGLELINTDLSIKPLPALFAMIQRKSYQVSRFYHPVFAERLKEILKESFDIVQFETVFPAVYLDIVRKHSNAKIVLRAHNIEHHIWKQLQDNEKNILKKLYLKEVLLRLKDFELNIFSKVDGIATISKRDKAFIELSTCRTPVIYCPFGINVTAYPLAEKLPAANTVFHLAAMNWMPNTEGIRWFLNSVWPGIIGRKPNARLILAGRHMPEWIIKAGYPSVEVLGEVESSWNFMLQHKIMIVPLFSGSGVRIKIIEGMLAGKAIISTSTGASGIDCTHNDNLLIADDAESFANAVVLCLDNPEKATELGNQAREFICNHHDIRKITPHLINFYSELAD